jgi:Actin like proteins N terminal domain
MALWRNLEQFKCNLTQFDTAWRWCGWAIFPLDEVISIFIFYHGNHIPVFSVPGFCFMPDLSVAIDVGGSSTKIVYQSAAMDNSHYWYMPPEVESISQAQLDRFFEQQAGLGKSTPELNAWLTIDDQVWVVGQMARHFMPENRIQEKKYENALYKVLAVIGVILDDDQFATDKTISLRLAMVLPMDEFGDRKRLQAQLQLMLKSFHFRGRRYRVKLDHWLCRPEGAGLMAFYLQQFPAEFANQSVGFVMLGHRNVTGLRFDAGELMASDSPLLGFAGLLDQVVAATSGIQPLPLCEALFDAMHQAARQIYQPHQTLHPKWATSPAMQALITVKQPTLREAELAELDRAVQNAIQDYWLRLERWLVKIFPSAVDSVVIGGGAALLLQPELEVHFNYPPCRGQDDYTGRRTWSNQRRSSTKLHWWTSLPTVAHDTKDKDPILSQFWQDGRSIDVRGLFTLLTEAD